MDTTLPWKQFERWFNAEYLPKPLPEGFFDRKTGSEEGYKNASANAAFACFLAGTLASRNTLYACQVTSGWEIWQESLHQTRAGAWRAGRKWLVAQFNQGFEVRATCGKSVQDFMPYTSFKVLPITVAA